MNGHVINHIIYADDLVLISPSSAGLCQLLHECEKFGMSRDVKYNFAKKSAVMIFRSVTLKRCFIPEFKLKWVTLHVVPTYKYLGNYISDDLSGDDDILIDNAELYMYKEILYCENLVCTP